MKLTEILLESINLIKYKNQVAGIIKKSLEESLKVQVPVEPGQDDEARAIVNHLSAKLYGKSTEEGIEFNLRWFCDQIMEKEAGVYDERGPYEHIQVSFTDSIKDLGQCYHNHISLNRTKLLKPFLDTINGEYIESVASSFNTIEDYNHEVKKYGINIDVNLDGPFNKLVDVLLHEMVHAIQHYRQWEVNNVNGRHTGYTEYRSYLEKDKKEFHKMMNSDEWTDRKNKAYYSSPQEIAAHAHNISLQIINDYGVDDEWVSHPSQLELSKNVKTYLSHVFSPEEFKDPKISKIINRYYRLVYKELEDYLSHVKKNKDDR
jgi:hypothetical protein